MAILCDWYKATDRTDATIPVTLPTNSTCETWNCAWQHADAEARAKAADCTQAGIEYTAAPSPRPSAPDADSDLREPRTFEFWRSKNDFTRRPEGSRSGPARPQPVRRFLGARRHGE
jgi:hypothetical protein